MNQLSAFSWKNRLICLRERKRGQLKPGIGLSVRRRQDPGFIARSARTSKHHLLRGHVQSIGSLVGILLSALLCLCSAFATEDFTRGVGVYPGDPAAFDGPVLSPETEAYRNLALHRPAIASSNYDYNLTAQLVTDGIIDERLPRWLVCSSSAEGILPRSEREHVVDGYVSTGVDLPAAGGWVQIEQAGRYDGPAVDRIEVIAMPRTEDAKPQRWTCLVSASDDGQNWRELGQTSGLEKLARETVWSPKIVKTAFDVPANGTARFYRLQLNAPSVTGWRVASFDTFARGQRVNLGGPYDFTSAWKSAGDAHEWIQVDLGADCTVDRVMLHWIRRAAEGAIEISEDATTWLTLLPLSAASDDYPLPRPERARYVRVQMTRPATQDGYIMSELQVFGRGGPVPQARPAPTSAPGARQDLVRGSWRIQRDSLVMSDGETLSQPGADCEGWLPATVPGTALVSFLNAGALPDPNYGDNQLQISDSFFYADFWYRNEFTIPAPAAGKKLWLNFDGINWKADVYFNGAHLGRIDGTFLRGIFDVTALVRPGGTNALAVRIHKPETPGSVREKTADETGANGGALGLDNPSFHATAGWDWIPSIRGRDIGIWSDVYLTTTGPVVIEHPLVSARLPLPDTSNADLSIEVSLRNPGSQAVAGVLRGQFGDVSFERSVKIPGATSTVVKFDPATAPALHLRNPRLWWPVGYGEPSLYDVRLEFVTAAGEHSDVKSFRAGVRQFTYAEEEGALKLFINGRRFIGRGGNWGFSESNLLYRAREYDAAVRYHRDMGFTMIRNWVGQVGDDTFFDACDRYGVVVWQDFWLANPADGPNPADNAMFLQNAADFIERIRNHPSVGLYCGRNEGNPPPVLNTGLERLVTSLHPGIRYIPNSAFGIVSGGGPYHLMPVNFYFDQRATPKLHSELGMANIVSMDSLRQMMSESDRWPQGQVWGLHDFTTHGAQQGGALRETIAKTYGDAANADEWVELAQFTNYDGHRAMFEAQSKHRMGVLMWMSHPCWPSFVWQTYDYYFEPTAGYFGAKKGCEPLHVQWNPLNNTVEVVNYSAGKRAGLTVEASVVNSDGSVQWDQTATIDSAEDSVVAPIVLVFPATGLTPLHFVRLRLFAGAATLSENTYLRSLKTYTVPGASYGRMHIPDYPAFDLHMVRALPKVNLRSATTAEREGDQWVLSTEVQNSSKTPALLVRLKAVRETTGDRILPALYEDNYLTLLPGETRRIRTELRQADTRGERPAIVVEGFNVQPPVTKPIQSGNAR
jgi:Exo-beta-D-glucosaminidase Ig-fold domain/Glycosyl hydrolases family 2/F5/8 type C domain/Glycosyl hydrolases family 2, sugar binding domain